MGTCCRAAGWEEVGKTKGFSRVSHACDFYIPNGRPKVLYMKPFRKDAWELAVANSLPPEYEAATHAKADGVLPFRPAQVESQHWELCHVRDPRGRNRTYHIGMLLAGFAGAGGTGLWARHPFSDPQAGRAGSFQRNVRLETERNGLSNENTMAFH